MAGRIRSIKPEILEDEKTAALSHLAWRLFVSLWLIADDYGNLRGDPVYVLGQTLWATSETRDTIAGALNELASVGLLVRYVVRGQSYCHISGWSKHQKVDKPGKPRMPGPIEGNPQPSQRLASGADVLAESSRDPREVLAPDLRSPISDPDQDRRSLPACAILPTPVPDETPVAPAPSVPSASLPALAREDIARTSPPEKPAPPPPRGEAPMLWRELEAARITAGAKLGLEILPLPIGERGERDLADLFVAARSRGPAEVETLVRQVRHAIAMAAAETTAGVKSPEWFTGAVFSPDNFRRLVAKQPAKPIAPALARPRRKPTEQPLQVSTLTPEERLALAAEARSTLGIADGARAPPTSAAITDEQQPQPAKAAT